MSLSLELTASEYWEEVYRETKRVQPSPRFPRRGYIPIPPYTVPILLESPILALEFRALESRPTWYVGGRCRQVIQSGNGPDLQGNQVTVPLNRGLHLYFFQRLAPQYQLYVEVPHWHMDSEIAVWQYSGPVMDTTEALIQQSTDQIRVDLVRIETKVNQLL